jgi:hypothetical protein
MHRIATQLIWVLFFIELFSCKPNSSVETKVDTSVIVDTSRTDTSAYPVNASSRMPSPVAAEKDSVGYKGMVIYPKGIPWFSDTLDLAGSTIGHLRYRQSVDIVSAFRRYEMSITDTISGKVVKGNWLKIKHNGKTGYVFTGYLYIERSDHFSATSFAADSNNVHLIKPGEDCSFNYQYNPNYHYYAVSKSGGTSILQETRISFFVTRENQGWPGPQVGEYYDYATDVKGSIDFVIGLSKELKTGKIPLAESYAYQEAPHSTKKKNFLLKEFRDEHSGMNILACNCQFLQRPITMTVNFFLTFLSFQKLKTIKR